MDLRELLKYKVLFFCAGLIFLCASLSSGQESTGPAGSPGLSSPYQFPSGVSASATESGTGGREGRPPEGLKGKAMGQPVYRLIGGPTREEMPAYASMLGYATQDMGLVRERAQQFKDLGFTAQKWLKQVLNTQV